MLEGEIAELVIGSIYPRPRFLAPRPLHQEVATPAR